MTLKGFKTEFLHETGQTGDWNWNCARRGGLGEKQKLGKQKAEMGKGEKV